MMAICNIGNRNFMNQEGFKSNAIVKYIDRSSLSLKGGRSPIALTTDVIKAAIELRQTKQLQLGDNWINSIWNWADSFGLSEKNLPRNRDLLLALTSLRVVYNDDLDFLPEGIGNLSNLTLLYMGSNNLEALPESIGNLSNLTLLYMGSNKLEALPESIGNLVNLTSLDITDNNLNFLPESIGNLVNLTSEPPRDCRRLNILREYDNEKTNLHS